MKYGIAIFFVLVSWFAHAADLEGLGNDVMYFYMQPTKEKFDNIQTIANANASELGKSKLMLSVEVARISEKNGWPIKNGVIGAMATQVLDRESDLYRYVNDDDQVSAEKLDIWWSSFFGTGEEVYLDKIFTYAGEEMPKGDLDRMMVIGAATWSFKANSKQHEAVKNYALKKWKESGLDAKKKEYVHRCIEYASE